jgi:anti-anti-sigma factor
MPERPSEAAELKWPLRIRQTQEQGVLVVTLTGRLGRASADALRQTLESAIDNGERRLVLDFEAVDYVSSAGLAALAAANSRLEPWRGALVLCALAEPVRIVFDLAGVLHQFAIEPSRALAIERVAR